MMNTDLWRKNILSTLKELGDKTYQEKVWLNGEGSEVSSFEEAICNLYDDYDFEGYIQHVATAPNMQNEYELLNSYNESLEKFLREHGDDMPTQTLLEDSDWNKLCQQANQTYSDLK